MSVMKIKKLYLFNTKEMTAKYVEFSSGRNVITSSKIDGNSVGKTTILKSIYHTLGADCSFDSNWPIKDIVYVLVVDIDNIEYIFYRHDKLQRVFAHNQLLCEATHKSDLSKFLEKQFGVSVYLPNRGKDQLELAPPAFSFVLNYLDKPKGPYFSSFEGLGQYTDVKETIIYNHLGAFDKRYYQLKRQQEQLLAQKKDTEEKLNVIALMIEKIRKDIIEADYSTDLEMLNREINQISHAYRILVVELSKLKDRIVVCSNQQILIEQQINSIKNRQKGILRSIEKANETRICPHCNSHIDELTVLRSTEYNEHASLVMLHDELSSNLIELNRQMEKLQYEYKKKLDKVNDYKRRIRKAKSYSEDIIRQEGAIQIREQFISDAEKLRIELSSLEDRIKDINGDLKEYQEKIHRMNEEYFMLIKDAFTRFSIKEIQEENIKTIKSVFRPTDNNIRLATVIWLYTLLQLKEKYNPTAMTLPILIDSPSFGELDDAKENELWKYVFSVPTRNTQLIITKLGLPDEMVEEYNVDNVIQLQNEKYRLLSRDEYDLYFEILKSLHQSDDASDGEQ